MASVMDRLKNCAKCNPTGTFGQCWECSGYLLRHNHWKLSRHSDFRHETNKLFATFFMGIYRLEDTEVLPLAHLAMFEEILDLLVERLSSLTNF